MHKLLPTTASLLLLTGCWSSPDALQQHTADATAAAKRDAGAIARGVAEGLTRKGPLDINEASEKQLATLPGLTPATAATIVQQRPYTATHDLVRRHILTPAEYSRIRAQIVVK